MTGGTGFVGTYTVLRALSDGYKVRTTVRTLDKEPGLRALIAKNGGEVSRLEIVAANLLSDDGWTQAVAGCTYVLHVASPFPPAIPKDENDVVKPAVEGTLRVLHAAKAAGVKRVVVTSSFAAIGYTPRADGKPFTELDWTNPQGQTPYIKSKTLAERAAWDYVRGDGVGLELSVINPVGIIGPAVSDDFSTSHLLFKEVLVGNIPILPNISFGFVDVRDVAELHLRAMTSPEAAGERFLACDRDAIRYVEIAKLIKAKLGDEASKVPTRVAPDFLIRFMGLFRPDVKLVASELGKHKRIDASKARRVLNWTPVDFEQSVEETARSVLAFTK